MMLSSKDILYNSFIRDIKVVSRMNLRPRAEHGIKVCIHEIHFTAL